MSYEFAELQGSEIEVKGNWVRFYGKVLVSSELASNGMGFGRTIRFEGPLHCAPVYRNPGFRQDKLFFFESPKIFVIGTRFHRTLEKEIVPRTVWVRSWLSRKMEEALSQSPGLFSLSRAVWFGDSSLLPKELRDFYTESGMLHVLALSGQHVSALILLFRSFCWMLAHFGHLFRLVYIARWSAFGSRWLPLFCVTILLFLSGSLPSIQRTFGMIAAKYGLALRGMNCTALQLICSTVALSILIEPELIAKPGFLLSAFATGFLIHVSLVCSWKNGVWAYVVFSLCMPLLIMPLSAFIFAKVAWISPLFNLVLSWFWSLVLIPIGFLIPCIVIALPHQMSSVLLAFLGNLWSWFVALNEIMSGWGEPFYHTVICPKWSEWLLFDGLMLFLIYKAFIRSGKNKTE